MTTVQQIQQEMTVLPEWAKEEVLDFVLFVKARVSKHDSAWLSRGYHSETLTQDKNGAWAALEALGQVMSVSWDKNRSAADAVAEIRR